jgi:hypothetical protein
MTTRTISAAGAHASAALTDRIPASKAGARGYLTGEQIAAMALSWSRGAITANAPILNLAETWNNAAVAFTGLRYNVTDSASAAGSLLLDLQIGGASMASVTKTGQVVSAAGFWLGGTSVSKPNIKGTDYTLQFCMGAAIRANMDNAGVFRAVEPGGGFLGHSTGFIGVGSDALLYRDAAGVLAQRNGVNPQTFRLYNTWTDPSNYERLSIGWASNVLYIDAGQVAGTGTARSLVLGGGQYINLNINGTTRFGVGGNGANMFAGALGGSQSSPILDMTQTWNTSGTPSALRLNITDTASAAGSLLLDLQVGGASMAKISKAGRATFGPIEIEDSGYISGFSTIAGAMARTMTQRNFLVSTSSQPLIALNSAGSIGFSASAANSDVTQNLDTMFRRDAAGVMAQRNGLIPQALRVYNTFTDASNSERFAIEWLSNVLYLRTQAVGTGGGRDIALGGNQVFFQTGGANKWQINNTGHFLAAADNVYDIGASAANRPRNIFVANQVIANDGYQFGNSSQMRSYVSGVIGLFNGAYNDFNRLQFGGTTTSFPALKRSATILQARLADDSAFTAIQGQLRTHANAVSETITPNATLTLYDAAGVAYKVPCVAA